MLKRGSFTKAGPETAGAGAPSGLPCPAAIACAAEKLKQPAAKTTGSHHRTELARDLMNPGTPSPPPTQGRPLS
jgi:hypothetical protein